MLKNYQYAIDLRVEVDGPVKPHLVSLDENKTPIPKIELFPEVFTLKMREYLDFLSRG